MNNAGIGRKPVDPVELTARLIKCPSVTPADAGALSILHDILSDAGFSCTRVDRGGIGNLFASWVGGGRDRVFGFNGHTDVVPAGRSEDWTVDPFGGEIREGRIWGRGAADMKSGVAAFVAAAIDFTRRDPRKGTISILVTGDEEGKATDGTVALLDWMSANGKHMDACLVGEPTCREFFGEMIKIGRRGSITVRIAIRGVQGHSAYPSLSKNAASAMARLVDRLSSAELDKGSESFQPSTLAVSTIDTGNTAANVIPGRCNATINIRFNDLHTSDSLMKWLRTESTRIEKEFGVTSELSFEFTGDAFVTRAGPFSEMVADAVEAETGNRPELSTSGGTSDARFIKDYCPVVEFGLVGASMHQIDESASIDEIVSLKSIYSRILDAFFE